MKKISEIRTCKYLYLCHTSTFPFSRCENWQYNRRVCPEKVENIKNFIKDNEIYCLEQVISIWSTQGKYFIYDGIHRLTALETIDRPMTFLISINYTKNEEDILCDFRAINSAEPVPEFMIKESCVLDSNKIVNSICEKLSSKYKKYVISFQKKTRAPFITRQNLMEKLDDLFTYSDCYNIIKNMDKMVNCLILVNEKLRTDKSFLDHIERKYTDNSVKIILNSGFYLGVVPSKLLKSIFEDVINPNLIMI
ncbi:MAG TPA: hypothetical protein V6C58_10185 [Allocoleopsis sp.]